MLNPWPFLIIAFAYGCCVGSFLNVVVFRLAEEVDYDALSPTWKKWLHRFPLLGSMCYDLGKLSHPPSHCPTCGHKLRAYDNIPILAWLWLKAKCRDCKKPISIQYPIIELICGLCFGAMFFVYYQTGLRPEMGLLLTNSWPVLLVHFALLAALLGATSIDARFFIIPHLIPYASLLFTLVALPLAVAMHWSSDTIDMIPRAAAWAHLPYISDFPWETGFGYGGLAGLIVGILLLKFGLIPQSFVDDPSVHAEQVGVDTSPQEDPSDPETWIQHPYLRREISKEILFLACPTLGAAIGVYFGGNLIVPIWVNVLGACLTGALVGGGLIWYIRVLGSLMFGKEAMGLGDVHLMLAIGAVMGWMDVAVCFFLAPFSGIVAAVLLPLLSRFSKGIPSVLPYGPHLAIAAFAMMLFRQPILTLLGMLPR